MARGLLLLLTVVLDSLPVLSSLVCDEQQAAALLHQLAALGEVLQVRQCCSLAIVHIYHSFSTGCCATLHYVAVCCLGVLHPAAAAVAAGRLCVGDREIAICRVCVRAKHACKRASKACMIYQLAALG